MFLGFFNLNCCVQFLDFRFVFGGGSQETGVRRFGALK